MGRVGEPRLFNLHCLLITSVVVQGGAAANRWFHLQVWVLLPRSGVQHKQCGGNTSADQVGFGDQVWRWRRFSSRHSADRQAHRYNQLIPTNMPRVDFWTPSISFQSHKTVWRTPCRQFTGSIFGLKRFPRPPRKCSAESRDPGEPTGCGETSLSVQTMS